MKRVPFLDLAKINGRYKQRFETAISDFLAQGRYLLGPELEAFEQEFARYCGVRHVIGVANGLDAIRLSLQALDIEAGHEVIVPAHTFIATWLGVSALGATPVPVDIDPLTGNIDPGLIEAAITPRTRAIIPVHLYGSLADMERITPIAETHQLKVIEDAAQAHGASQHHKRAGQHGIAAAFSFYPGKNLGALGDAGAIACQDDALALRLRKLRNYGSDIKYHHDEPGLNSRLDDLQALFLRIRLESLDDDNKVRREQAAFYTRELADCADLRLPSTEHGHQPVWHLYVVRSPARNALRDWLAQDGIESLIHYPTPPHLQPAYRAMHALHFPCAEAFAQECLSLPIGPHLEDDQLASVCMSIRRFFDR